jgi:hypothetical protein
MSIYEGQLKQISSAINFWTWLKGKYGFIEVIIEAMKLAALSKETKRIFSRYV